MATKFKLNDCVPCIAIHPGEIIKDELDAREMKQKELASFMGMPTSVLNDIIKGRRAITPEVAVLLQEILSIDASYWLSLQNQYDIDKANINTKIIERKRNIEIWKIISQYCSIKCFEKLNIIGTKISENIKTMYKVYAVTINNEIETYVNTVEEAETIVAEMQSEYSEDVAKVGIQEQYTTDFESVGTQSLEVAKLSVDTDLRGIKTEQERIAEATFNGVYFSVKPVVGNITSRYGVVETSVRNHAHGGLDIAAPYGTSIKAAADGTISYSGWMSGYGYLIIIDHANGVQTYYGHCSKLYASVGDEVTAGDVIAAVGSTGNSTGNHLHLEIRLNGNKINPQLYLYK